LENDPLKHPKKNLAPFLRGQRRSRGGAIAHSITMTNGEILSGQHAGWTLLEKLAEGDAGEIYRVEALGDGRRAILKRPVAAPSRAISPARLLRSPMKARFYRYCTHFWLPNKDLKASVPALLDQSQPGSERSENQFIVIEPASGFDLRLMTRLKYPG
jgi:hypothetical protein